MAEGGTQALSAAELNEALFPMAAELGVQSDKELTVFVARVHRDHLQKFLHIFSDVLVRPRFDPKEFGAPAPRRAAGHRAAPARDRRRGLGQGRARGP